MRLIDADKLIEKIKEQYKIQNGNGTDNIIGDIIHNLIEKEYDVSLQDYNVNETYDRLKKDCCELFKLIPKEKINNIFDKSEMVGAECDHTFLCFEEIYKAVTLFVPKGRVIIDFGCAYAFQAWYFRYYKKYIAVDVFDDAEVILNELGLYNTEFYQMSIQKFIKEVFPTLGYSLDRVFAICSYVPDKEAMEMVRKSFPHCLTYYPTFGIWK